MTLLEYHPLIGSMLGKNDGDNQSKSIVWLTLVL